MTIKTIMIPPAKAEEKEGKLIWTVYCLDCKKAIDKAPNGALMQSAAEIHAYKTGHRVILGSIYKRA